MNAAAVPAIGVTAQRLIWIVVQSRPGQEVRAKTELEKQGFEVYLPMRLFQNRKGETRATPFFPGYMFVHVSPRPQEWRQIFSTYGVNAVLGCTPTRAYGVKDRIVQRLLAEEEGGFIKMGLAQDQAPVEFVAGGRVMVRAGMWADFEAVFLERIDAKRALILVSLFGRDSDVKVDLRQIEQA